MRAARGEDYQVDRESDLGAAEKIPELVPFDEGHPKYCDDTPAPSSILLCSTLLNDQESSTVARSIEPH